MFPRTGHRPPDDRPTLAHDFKPGFERLCAVVMSTASRCSCTRAAITDITRPHQRDRRAPVRSAELPADALGSISGQVTFCPVDIQKTLQTGDEAAIAAEARALIDHLGGPEGGFVAGYYGDNVAIGLDPHWQDVACRTFMEHGRYR